MSAILNVSKRKICPIVGKFRTLKSDTLLTIKNVCFQQVKEQLIASNVCTRNVHAMAISKVLDVLDSLLIVWGNRNLPTASKTRIKFLFDKFNMQRLRLLKSFHRDSDKDHFKKRLNAFTRKINVLFNIRMNVGSKKSDLRSSKEDKKDISFTFTSSCDDKVGRSDADTSRQKLTRKCKKLPQKSFPLRNRNHLQLPTVSSLLDRFKVSSAIRAAISSATLVDVGVITTDDMSNVIDTCKIRRAREKHRKNVTKSPRHLKNLKDCTLTGKRTRH